MNPVSAKPAVSRMAASSSLQEKETVRAWLQHLLEIRDSGLPVTPKVRHSPIASAHDGVMFSFANRPVKKPKRLARGERGQKGRA
ncbi:MAG: hypothetical protein N2Z69_03475 [Methylophilaceae bacterium]|nr:hypothetical protein [Methylophilaceae bacterium]